jgi:hypothetical protein
MVSDQSGLKIHETTFQLNGWMQWHTPVITTMWGSTDKRFTIQDGLGIKWDSASEITNTKRASEVVQVVECLPCKGKAWVQLPVSTKKGLRHNNM